MRTRWNRVEALFDEVAELPPTERERMLRLRCGNDIELQREVASLAASLDGADEFVAARAPCENGVGPYRIIREIASGGMGTVYLAVRGDGEFRQRVAIKIARDGLASAWTRERFRQERQMMADLTHPNVARLIDGGTTQEGIPYLVMEYIEGQSITTYVAESALPVKARLKLFLGVCEAVSYAHRNLVVHRDIKPGNILVTADGTPKLLDFGISKLLSLSREGERGLTIALMTPEYASPEQLRGEAVNTSTDVYSLGAVLKETLTCDAGAASLPKELDAVVAVAMRPEASHRYPSVEHLSADVTRYLESRPVAACKGAFTYRIGKFARRHRLAVAFAGLLALTLAGGVAAVLWQVHRVAVQVTRAERRFVQFEQLAKTFLFDFHTRIQSMRDVSEARQLVLKTGLEYVDKLALEAGDDPLFSRELARAYDQFGNLQGYRHEVAMARPADALVSYHKAIALLEPHQKSDATAALLLSRCWCNAGDVSERIPGHRAEAEESYGNCLKAALAAPAYAQRTSSKRVDLLLRSHAQLGDLRLMSGDHEHAREHYDSMLDLINTGDVSPEWKKQEQLADFNRRVGRLRAATGDHNSALAFLRTARARARLASAANEKDSARTLLRVLRDLAVELNQPVEAVSLEARQSRSEALALARKLSAERPFHPLVTEELQSVLAIQSVRPEKKINSLLKGFDLSSHKR